MADSRELFTAFSAQRDLLDINVVQTFIEFIVLLFSLTVHEMAHAWTADRLGDPTGRLAGRVSLNPVVHTDLIGTVLFPLVALATGAMLIGWAKPVPANIRRLKRARRDYVLVAAAGPASNRSEERRVGKECRAGWSP